MITDVPGVRVGHWTNPVARTGCTVVLLPAGTVASGEVRGGAPGTREFDLLAPERLVQHVNAVVLSGGSAFGLATCEGVVDWCEERGIGFPTGAGPVPIVVGAVIYDLGVGDPSVRPGRDSGYAACVVATPGRFETGAVGAGTGATTGKWRASPYYPAPGGLGTATVRHGDLVVSALFVVNAWGGLSEGDGAFTLEDLAALESSPSPLASTTVGVVATNAALDKTACLLVAQSGHDGLARALRPAHTVFDGDAVVAAATGETPASLEVVRAAAGQAAERAVRTAPPAPPAPASAEAGST